MELPIAHPKESRPVRPTSVRARICLLGLSPINRPRESGEAGVKPASPSRLRSIGDLTAITIDSLEVGHVGWGVGRGRFGILGLGVCDGDGDLCGADYYWDDDVEGVVGRSLAHFLW